VVRIDVDALRRVAAAAGFSGVVRVDRGDDVVLEAAFGLADRAHGVPNTATTQFGTASATKGLTALTVMRLVEQGVLSLSTTARSVLGADLPLVDDRVTVEHLLAHRSGIGDYLDEDLLDDITEYVMPVPVHRLDSAEAYLSVLDGFPTAFEPDSRFSYCNGGYVVLALLAERAAGTSYHDLVRDLVCEPAGLHDTAFLRSDELPGGAARGYLATSGLRTNVLHLPVLGCGDGGAYTTVSDVRTLWRASFAGAIVSRESVALMTRPHSRVSDRAACGLGFWLPSGSGWVELEGFDAGVACWTRHHPDRDETATVLSNCSVGSEPVVRFVTGSLA
jgi:CubicO group peptidase (beta-lactamase class C family)